MKLKVKNVLIIVLLTILILLSSVNVSKAVDYGATMNLSNSKNTANVGDTITFILSLQSVTNVEGVATVHAKINYDNKVLEYVSCEAVNSWSAVNYNEENNEFVTERSDVMKPTGEILKITFKVISIPNDKTTTVSITNFDVADIENEIAIPDVTANLTIEEKETNSNNTDTDNKKEENNQNSANVDNNNNKEEKDTNNSNKENTNNDKDNQVDNTIQTGNLPQTGLYTIIPFVVAIFIVMAIIFTIKYSKMKDI